MLRSLYCSSLCLVAALVSSGCQYSPSIADRTIAYNRAVSESANQLLLLNAVRASLREPTIYTRDSGDTVTSTIQPSFSISGGLGANKTLTTTTAPANISNAIAGMAKSITSGLSATEQNQLALQNLDDQQSTNGLMSPVSPQILSQYLKEGWNKEQIILIFMNSIQLKASLLRKLPDAIAENCWRSDQSIFAIAELERAGETIAHGDAEHRPDRNPYCVYFFPKPPETVSFSIWVPEINAPNPHPAGGHDRKLIGNKWYDRENVHKYDPGPRWLSPSGSGPQHMLLHPACFAGEGSLLEVPRTNGPVSPVSVGLSGDTDILQNIPNDPALDRNLDEDMAAGLASRDQKSFSCFKEVVRALLALNLEFVPNTSHQVMFRLPLSAVSRNPRVLADFSQQGLEVVGIPETPSAKPKPQTPRERHNGEPPLPRQIAVCKTADGIGMIYASDPYLNYVLGLASYNGKISVAESQPAQATSDSSPTSIVVRAGTGNQAQDSCQAKAMAWGTAGVGSDGSAKPEQTAFTPRSLDDMVYFVGQIVRRSVDEHDDIAVSYWNAADQAHPYEEELIRILTAQLPPLNAVVSVEHEGHIYYVPPLCDGVRLYPGADKCTAEYPNHAGADTLTLLNQIWGLEKTATTLPPVPTVTVINPP